MDGALEVVGKELGGVFVAGFNFFPPFNRRHRGMPSLVQTHASTDILPCSLFRACVGW
jgi:hypothetical protein